MTLITEGCQELPQDTGHQGWEYSRRTVPHDLQKKASRPWGCPAAPQARTLHLCRTQILWSLAATPLDGLSRKPSHLCHLSPLHHLHRSRTCTWTRPHARRLSAETSKRLSRYYLTVTAPPTIVMLKSSTLAQRNPLYRPRPSHFPTAIRPSSLWSPPLE